MYPDIDWAKERDLAELRVAYALISTNFDLAKRKLEQLAEKGSIASMWYLADAYSSGRQVAKDLEQASVWYRRAEASGWTPASYRLGRIYFELNDYGAAFDAFSRGASHAYVPAVYRLGMMYKEGLGTKKDLNECRRLLTMAMCQGHLFAKRDLAGLYMMGSFGIGGIPKGVGMLASLFFDMIVITATREWKNPALEDRVLA